MTLPASHPASLDRRRLLRRAATWSLAPLTGARMARAAQPPGIVRLLCVGPAGSPPDLVARSVAAQLPRPAGGAVVVDNRPGAAGQLGVAALKSAGDGGATLLLGHGALATLYPALYPRLGYDPALDLQPVSLACETALALAVGPAVPAEVDTLAGFVAWLRQHPARANLGSPGIGTLPHLLAAMLLHADGVAWQHLPYSGGPPAVTDLLGGRVAAVVLPEGMLRAHHAAGRLRLLATSGRARSAALPGVPTFAELQRPALSVTEWFAFFAPAGAASARIDAASRALRDALALPAVGAALASAGLSPASSTPAELAARITAERGRWPGLLRQHAIQIDA